MRCFMQFLYRSRRLKMSAQAIEAPEPSAPIMISGSEFLAPFSLFKDAEICSSVNTERKTL